MQGIATQSGNTTETGGFSLVNFGGFSSGVCDGGRGDVGGGEGGGGDGSVGCDGGC